MKHGVDARRLGNGVTSWLAVVVVYSAVAVGADEPVPSSSPTDSGAISDARGRAGGEPRIASRAIPPPVRFDLRVLRAQAEAQPPASPADGAPPSPAPEPRVVPNLEAAAAERALGGGEPTEETAKAAPSQQATTLLMRALKLDDSPVRVYGWLQNSYTGNANGRPANGLNFGVNPNHQADRWMANQYYLIVENPLEQNDSVNFGFRVDNLFGNDWQFNYMQGLFNRAFIPGHLGYDLSQLYGEAHLPVLTPGGLDVKAGLWYTLAGYEQVPAISRPLLSVPYMFNYGQPFRHVGVVTTLHLTPRINLYNGSINGWDRWIDERYIWGYIGGFSWASADARTNVAFTCVSGPDQFPRFLPANQPIYPTGYINIPSLAGLPNPGYAHNTRTLFTTVLTHRWDDKLTQVVESDQAWELNVPGLASDGLNGAPKTARWFSVGNWFLYQATPKLTGVWRGEAFWDPTGARTGYADTYYEMTLGLIYKPKDHIWIRPEARYDWAQSGKPYSNDTRNSQLTLGVDIIFLY
jgi:putative OmpL-like beta-barrel porin-2